MLPGLKEICVFLIAVATLILFWLPAKFPGNEWIGWLPCALVIFILSPFTIWLYIKDRNNEN